MRRVIAVVKNRYIITGVAFVVWMMFFDRHDIATQYGYYSQLKNLKAEKAFYSAEIERVNKTVHDIHTNPQEVQRIAREKYQMKKDNEDVFVIIEENEPQD